MNIVLINSIFVGLFIVGSFYLWFRTRQLKSRIKWQETAGWVLLSISVPKNNDRTPQAAEQMFAALHGVFREGATTQQHLSFELASKHKTITFYVYVPQELKDFVASQIFAQYPNVEITEVESESDYVLLEEQKAIAATELTLKKASPYPIKTFQNFEVDPLSAITGVLSSVTQDEEIWVQLIVRPVDDEWQTNGEKVIKEVKEPVNTTSFTGAIAQEAKGFAVDFIRTLVAGPATEQAKKEEKKNEELGGPIQQAIKGIEEKITKLGFEANIRILAAASTEHMARAKLEQVVGAYKQFNTLNMNSFTFKAITSDKEALALFKDRSFGEATMLFNITELASLYHFPSETVATPTIAWAGSKKGEPPQNLPIVGAVPAEELTVFAQTNFRNEVKKFGIKKGDRRLHMYMIGKTGTGKSTLMENMIIDDVREGRGLAVVDPHGELIKHILEFIPEERVQDVVYFNPADVDFPVGFNLLENVGPEMKNVVASGVVGVFKKIFGESWGPRLEYILRNSILALLDYPNSTLLGVMRVLTDNAYRRLVVNEISDPVIRDFFINEYEKYDPKFRQEAIAPIQNKVGQFLSASTIRNIVGQPKSTIDIRQIMDGGKILLADLSVGKIGEDNSSLLGSMLITKVQLAAMGRVEIPESERRDFYLYVDEFQNFATDSFATILSEARKYRLNLVMTNQYIAQMPETVANAVFGNVGTMISFRVGAGDADALVKEFEPIFEVNDLVNLDNYQIYLKMAIDGVTVPAFSAATLPPRLDQAGLSTKVIEQSRQAYSRTVEEVEDYITEWSAPINLSDNQNKVVGKQPFEAIKTEPTAKTAAANIASPEATPETEKEPATGESERKLPESRGVPSGLKIEMLKDRFDRPWYAVGKSAAAEKNTTVDEGGGEAEENDGLITWEQAESLGISDRDRVKKPTSSDDILPLEEIR